MTTAPTDDSLMPTLPARQDFTLPDASETQGQLAAIAAFQTACRTHLVEGVDYGTIPGTAKPTLLKPGAEKLVRLLGLRDEYEIEAHEDWDKPLFHYSVRCRLTHLATGHVITYGVGECNSMEGRYRWRQGKKRCPECYGETIIKGKAEFGGGWLCFRKQGGCGEKFDQNDPAITSQPAGRIENDDIYSQVNTILKMAKKRALVDAALSAGRLSDVFTQDLEDMPGPDIAEASPPPSRRQVDGKQRTERQLSTKHGQCDTHGKQFLPGPQGRIGHPVGDGSWCWQDEATPKESSDLEPSSAPDLSGDAPVKGSLEGLKQHLELIGWTWDAFQEHVLNASWEDFVQAGGTPAIAWKRFENYQEQQADAS